jgi:RecA-family ATPase
LVLLTGKTKIGKSSLARDIAIGAASGTGAVRIPEGGWLFDFAGKRQRTFYLDTENRKGLLLRSLGSLCSEKGEKLTALLEKEDLIYDPLEMERRPPFLSGAEDNPKILNHIQVAKRFGARMRAAGVSLIILDEMSHCYQEDTQGRDELSHGFVRDFFRIINAIVSESGACVLLIHHQRKGLGKGVEMSSGSSQMLSKIDLLLTISKQDEELGFFTLEKQGRQISSPGKVHLKASSTKDDACRIFIQISEPVEPSRSKKRTKKANRGTYEGS